MRKYEHTASQRACAQACICCEANVMTLCISCVSMCSYAHAHSLAEKVRGALGGVWPALSKPQVRHRVQH